MRDGGSPARAARCLSLLLYSPAQDGKHIKCFPLRAELAINLITRRSPPTPGKPSLVLHLTKVYDSGRYTTHFT